MPGPQTSLLADQQVLQTREGNKLLKASLTNSLWAPFSSTANCCIKWNVTEPTFSFASLCTSCTFQPKFMTVFMVAIYCLGQAQQQNVDST